VQERCPCCDHPLTAEKAEEVRPALEKGRAEALQTKEKLEALSEWVQQQEVKRQGRPSKPPVAGERVQIGVQVAPDLKARLEAASEQNHRSLSREAEFRLQSTLDRQDLLAEVLALAYGREAAGFLIMLGLAMARAGEFTHVDSGAAADGVASWTDNATAFGNVIHAVLALLDSAKPEENYAQRPGIGMLCATELIKSIGDPTARSWFTAHSRTVATIRSLLGPVADRMVKAAETRPIVSLDPREQARRVLVADLANVLAALVSTKMRLHETGRADSPAPSRHEIAEVLAKRFPAEQYVSAAHPSQQSTKKQHKTRSNITGELKVRKAHGVRRKVRKP